MIAQSVAPEPAAREQLVVGLCASLSAAQIAEMVEKVELLWRQGSQAYTQHNMRHDGLTAS